ncbi:MAG: FtsX-like permease family protein [Thermoanaerobaculia bacterium]|nr:FtsX-like permease family protein [Thermoanaerobaculia bacterium]
MRRSLLYYWRTHLAVAVGAAVATAVLTGALIVGDSVRGSLRDLTLDRLGEIDVALVGERPFRQGLGADLEAELGGELDLAPTLLLSGSAVHGASRARASRVTILGAGPELARLYPEAPELPVGRQPGLLFPSVVLNEALAGELGAAPGDEVLLSFEIPSDVPRETLVGREEAGATVGTLRLSVGGVIPDRGLGGLRLTPGQARPMNAFVERERLQRAVFGRGADPRVNLLLLAFPGDLGATPGSAELADTLGSVMAPADLGLEITTGAERVVVESDRFVLDPAASRAVLEAARASRATAQEVLTYFATALRSGDRSIPYSTISALDPPAAPALGAFRLVDGSPAPRLAEDELLLNRWAAEDLGARPGDEIEVEYYELGARDELFTRSVTLRLAGVVEIEGLAADPRLTPEFPGLEDAQDISSWDPPFPVDLDAIRGVDEEYWDAYRSLPKAYVAASLGRRLWKSRFGDLTSIRLAPGEGSAAELAGRLRAELPRRLSVEEAGLAFRQLKRDGLEAARGATDFSGLFLGLSFFLIASAVLLVGLLFRLGIERRAREVGLLRAVGYRARTVRRSLLAEGGVLAALGALAGLGGAVFYAWLMLAGLRTWWLPAVGTPVLFLHVGPATPVIGWVASVLVVLATIWWTLRRLGRVSAARLLAGAAGLDEIAAGRRRRPLLVAVAFSLLAAALLAAAFATGETSSPGFAFGIGACLLIAGVAGFAHLCGGPPGARANGLRGAPLVSMGARNTGRNRGRSVLSVALVASACFLIVAVDAFRGGGEAEVTDRASGAGGFTLVAETDVPVVAGLDRPETLRELGFSDDEAARLAEIDLVPFRLLPGEDVSCLNLFRPERPRVLGVTPEMRARGGFSFQQVAEKSPDPWSLLAGELEPGVLPAFGDFNSVLWILHSGLGQEISLENERGETVRLRFVGLLAKGIFQSEVLISEENFLAHFPSRTGYSWFLADPPLNRVEETAAMLESRLERFGFDATPTAERLSAFKAVENTYIATFQTLGGFGLLLGTLGLGIVLLRNVLERRGELAMLRAFGYRRSTLARMVVAENAILLLAGVGIGAVAGLAAAAPHLSAGGETVPWLSLGLTLLVVVAVGMLASTLAVAGTLRTPLLGALKAE